VRVNPQDQVENERSEYQPDHAQQQVRPPICEAPVEWLAIATRLSLGVVSVAADAAPPGLRVPLYVSRGGALSIPEKACNFWKRLPPAHGVRSRSTPMPLTEGTAL
jgi:hypothetical protein